MKLDNQDRAFKLAIVNSISENAYDSVEVAQKLIDLLYKSYPNLLKNYYKLEKMDEVPGLAYIAYERKQLLPGGLPDINRCASMVLSDFRHGRIGRITLENAPQD